MKIQQFAGGLATRLAPHLIQIDQGVEYQNIDTAPGVLKPVLSSNPTDIVVDKYNAFYIKGDEWVSAAIPTTFLEYQNVMYSANGSGRPMKRFNNIDNYVGIELPEAAPSTVATATDISPLDTFDVTNDITQGDLPRSEVAYRLYTKPAGSSHYSAPLELVVAETSTANPELTSFTSATILEQGTSEDSDGIDYGVYPTSPGMTFSHVNSQAGTGPRSITISNIASLDDTAYTDARLYRYYSGTWYLLNTFTATADSFLDDTFDISANTELDEAIISPFNGTYQYVYTYYNSTDGTESAPSPLAAELEVLGGEVNVTLVASSDPQVTKYRIYRVGGKRTLFAMVAEITSLAYTDSLLDSEMDGRLLESENYYAAPEGLDFISESYAMLFGAVDYTLYFTPIGEPNAWPPEYSIQFNAPITGIGPVANGVLVMTRTQTFIVTGTGPLSLSMQTLRGDQGCISHHSIQEVAQGALVWASTDGLCSSSGSNVVSISKTALGDIKLDPVNSAVVDEVYYLHLTDGTTLVWDYRFTPVFKKLSLGLESVTAANSEIYGWSADVLYELFKGSTATTFQYISPRFVDDYLTESKTYKKVYISHDGDIIINIIINDVQVASKALSGKDSTVIQVPSDKQRGYYIQFEVSGTGTVNEIKYMSSGQKDG